MKQLLAIPLILVMLVKPLWPLAEYLVNYDYIVTSLCENRDKPQLNCDGKCYLTKMFAEKTTDNDENPFAEGRILEIPLFLNTNTTIANELCHQSDQSQVVDDSYLDMHTSFFVFEIVQPPEV